MRALENARNEDRKLMVRRGFDGGGDSEQSLVEQIDLEQQVDQLQSLAKELKQDNQRERHRVGDRPARPGAATTGRHADVRQLPERLGPRRRRQALGGPINALLAKAIAEVHGAHQPTRPTPIRPNPVSLTAGQYRPRMRSTAAP